MPRRTSVLSLLLGLLGIVTPHAGGQAVLHTISGVDGDQLGSSVAGAGDVDGDGFADLVVGAWQYAHYGNAKVLSGQSGVVLHTVFGDSTGDQLGTSVAAAGDVDGDGFADVALGARGDEDQGANTGSIRVLSGSSGAVLYVVHGEAAGDEFGWSLAAAGDVDLDGEVDLVVGARGSDGNGTNAGSVRILSGATAQGLQLFHGDGPGDQLGFAVAGAGDVDGDGFSDVIAGAWLADDHGFGAGSARIVSGATGATLHTVFGDSPFDQFGRSVAAAGDVDLDGVPDLIVGADGDDENGLNAGSARVHSGATGAILHVFRGDSASEWLGSSVAGPGDVSGDGVPDLVVGARGYDSYLTDVGSVRTFSGATGALISSHVGTTPGGLLGTALAVAGDVNGDGRLDLVLGVPGTGHAQGGAKVVSGWTGTILHDIAGDDESDSLGNDVAAAGDVDGDGFADLIVGASGDDDAGTNAGSARVVSGSTGTMLHAFFGDSAGDFFGGDVAGTGDIDGDGLSDLIVGSSGDNAGDGSAWIFSGATGALLSSVHGTSSQQLGSDVAGAGDVDIDGVPDVIVGVSGFGLGSGSALVLSGATGAVLHLLSGDPGDAFGTAVAGAGDVDGDGSLDILVGAPGDDIFGIGENAGTAFVYSGATGAVLRVFHGDSGGDDLGRSLAGVGDVDDDGFDDVIVGASGDAPNGPSSGSAFVFSGGNGTKKHAFSGESDYDLLGISVGGAGDVDGDGTPDVIVGSFHDGIEVAAGNAQVLSGATGNPIDTVWGMEREEYLGAAVAGAGDVNGDGFPDWIVGATHADAQGTNSGRALVVSANLEGPPPSWTSLGGGTPGAAGIPGLLLAGPLTPRSRLALDLVDGAPSTPAFLFIALDSRPLPFLGGTLHAYPFVELVLLATDGAGEIHGSTTFPGTLPGQQLWFQFGLVDASVPLHGACLSNSVRGIAP